MAFPQTPLDVLIELFISGAWVDVTADVYTANKIVIKRGRADEGTRTDPGSCSLTLNNRLGKYSPRNPLSPYYGLIGRNTPLRVSVPGPTSYLELDGNAANYASTPDTAALDITGDLDLRWEGEASWYAPGAQMLIGKWSTAPGNRSYHLRLQDGLLCFVATTDGTSGFFLNNLLPPLPRRAALRATLDIDNGAGGATMRLYWAPSLSGPWTQVGSDGVVAGGPFSVFAGNAPLFIAPTQPDATPVRTAVTGKVYKAEVRNGIDGTVVASPDFTAQTPGVSSFTDSAGCAWTLSGNAKISNRRIRFTGEVSSWPSKWDVSGKDVYVPVEAAGILRRIGQGAKALDSTLRRRIPSGNPLAYWPMEDGSAAVQAASAIDGVAPLTLTGVTYASDTSLPSSDALPVLGQSSTLAGTVPGAKPGGWHVEMVYKLDKMPAIEQSMLSVRLKPDSGGVTQVLCRISTAGIRVQALDIDGNIINEFLFTNASAISDFTGKWNRLQVYSATSGSQSYANVQWRNVITNTWWNASTNYTGTPGTINAVRGAWGSDFQGMAIGHLSAFNVGGTTAPAAGVTIYDGSDDGFNGETAWTRMQRVAGEEGLPITWIGGGLTTERVGPQTIDTLLTLVEDAADVDGGILYEQRDKLSLVYRDRSSLYNQKPALLLDYLQPGHVAPPLEPIDDDQQVRNDRTVQRTNGSSARAVQDTGPLSVQAPPAGVGVYDDSTTLNLYSDTQTEPQAWWRLHLGTVDEARYPVVNLNLAAAPQLADQVTAMDCGDRIQIANPPAWLPPGPIDLIMQGDQETIGHPNDWELQLNCTPASAWTVGEIAVVEDFESSLPKIPITDGGTLPWNRSQAHYNTGSWSLRSGAITNNQTSDATFAVPDGATELNFWYYTNTEASGPGFEGDRLLVLVDGAQALRAQGSTPWTSATINVTGASQVTFRYVKDNSTAAGEDAVWIDDLVFVRRAPMRVDTDGSQLAVAATAAATSLTVATTTGQPWITSAAYPADFPFDISVGGERMRVTSVTGAVTDTFSRTVANGWGTPDAGQAWTVAGGTAADYSVGSGYGVAAQPTTNVAHVTLTPSPSADVDLVVDVASTALAAGANQVTGPLARAIDGSNWYCARVEFTTTGTVTLGLRKRVGGTETALVAQTATGLTHTAGTFYRVRFQVIGSTLRARMWTPGTPEPGNWLVQTTDTSLTAAANIGTRSFASSASTVTGLQLWFENLQLLSPQTFTVVRSRNGIVKAQSAGADVRLADPAIVAL